MSATKTLAESNVEYNRIYREVYDREYARLYQLTTGGGWSSIGIGRAAQRTATQEACRATGRDVPQSFR